MWLIFCFVLYLGYRLQISIFAEVTKCFGAPLKEWYSLCCLKNVSILHKFERNDKIRMILILFRMVMFYPRLQKWVNQINLLKEEWFVLWNIMWHCVNMHHAHSDRNNILFLLRSCIYWVQKEKKRELRKVCMMHIILIIDFGLNHCDNLQKEWTSGNQYLQEME